MKSLLVQTHPQAKDVCIVFSARATEAGRFTFFKTMEGLPLNVVFVNDWSNQWFRQGTPEMASQQELIEHLRGLVQQWRGHGGRLLTLGSSMGAYAALKFGSILEADRVLALGPESHLCIPLGRSVESVMDAQEGDGDIAGLSFRDDTQVMILSGNNDIVDMYCASLFKAAHPQFEIGLINNRTHVVAKYLNAQIGLTRIVSEFLIEGRKDFLPTCELGVVPSALTAAAVKRYNEDLSLGTGLQPGDEDLVVAEAARQPTWSMVQYFAGLIALNRSLPDLAEKHLLAAVVSSGLGRARLKLAQLLFDQRRYPESLRLIDEAASPLSWSLARLKAQTLVAVGRRHEALALLEHGAIQGGTRERGELRASIQAEASSETSPLKSIDSVQSLAALGVKAQGLIMRDACLHLPAAAKPALLIGACVALVGLELSVAHGGRVSIGSGSFVEGRIRVERGGWLCIDDHACLVGAVNITVPAGVEVRIGRLSRLESCQVGPVGSFEVRVEGETAPTAIRIGARCLVEPGASLVLGACLPDGGVLTQGSVLATQEKLQATAWLGNPARASFERVRWQPSPGFEGGSAMLLRRFGGPLNKTQSADPAWVAGHVRAHLAELAVPVAEHYAFHYHGARALYEVDHLAAPTEAHAAYPRLEPAALRDVLAACNDLTNDRNQFCWAYEVAACALAGDEDVYRLRRDELLSKWPDMQRVLDRILINPPAASASEPSTPAATPEVAEASAEDMLA